MKLENFEKAEAIVRRLKDIDKRLEEINSLENEDVVRVGSQYSTSGMIRIEGTLKEAVLLVVKVHLLKEQRTLNTELKKL